MHNPVKMVPRYVLLPLFFAVGTISAISGIGGGVFLVPILMGIGMTHKKAVTLSLLSISISSIFSSTFYIYHSFVDMKVAVILAISSIPMSYVGSELTLRTKTVLFKKIFAIFIVFIAILNLL